MLTRDEIVEAAADYDEEFYPAELYRDRLAVLQRVESDPVQLKDAVCDLFHWKLGKATKFRTPTSYPLAYVNPEGSQYYGIKMTRVNKSAIEVATRDDLINDAIRFRDGELPYEKIKSSVSKITKSSIVLPTFYLHIWKPNEHPIFGENVWKLYRQQMGHDIKAGTKPESWKHYEIYVPWYCEIVDQTGLDPLIADRGLWVLGGEIKAETNRKGRGGRPRDGKRILESLAPVENVVRGYLALSPEDKEMFRKETDLR